MSINIVNTDGVFSVKTKADPGTVTYSLGKLLANDLNHMQGGMGQLLPYFYNPSDEDEFTTKSIGCIEEGSCGACENCGVNCYCEYVNADGTCSAVCS